MPDAPQRERCDRPTPRCCSRRYERSEPVIGVATPRPDLLGPSATLAVAIRGPHLMTSAERGAHAGESPCAAPVTRATASRRPGVPRGGAPGRWPDFSSSREISVSASPGPPRRPARRRASSAGWSFPSSEASEERLRGGPSTARWRWLAWSSARRASPGECAQSLRGQTPRLPSTVASLPVDPLEPSAVSSSPAWRTPPLTNVGGRFSCGKRSELPERASRTFRLGEPPVSRRPAS
jgi:hypothetical protein